MATAVVIAAPTPELAKTSHPASVRTERPITTGTKTPEARSAQALGTCLARLCLRYETGDLRQRRLGADLGRPHDEPARSVEGAARHVVARAYLDGTFSPLSIDRSIAERPSVTTPSLATLSPGRTTKRSPMCRAPMGTTTSAPSLSTCASLAPTSSNALIAFRELSASLVPRGSGPKGPAP